MGRNRFIMNRFPQISLIAKLMHIASFVRKAEKNTLLVQLTYAGCFIWILLRRSILQTKYHTTWITLKDISIQFTNTIYHRLLVMSRLANFVRRQSDTIPRLIVDLAPWPLNVNVKNTKVSQISKPLFACHIRLKCEI